jgi:hypothetical protein
VDARRHGRVGHLIRANLANARRYPPKIPDKVDAAHEGGSLPLQSWFWIRLTERAQSPATRLLTSTRRERQIHGPQMSGSSGAVERVWLGQREGLPKWAELERSGPALVFFSFLFSAFLFPFYFQFPI